jgi:adenine phosphoribosyltransferase
MDLKSRIREIPNFPKDGILFYDITTLLKDAEAFHRIIHRITQFYQDEGVQKVVAVESRGFILGAPVASQLKAGFVPVRKQGKLPSDIFEARYDLEYGTDTLTVHQDAISPGERVLIVDDLLATGGTISATVNLVEQLGGIIQGVAFLVELTELQGRRRLGNYNVISLISY